MLKNLTISCKLSLSFALIILIILVMAAIALLQMGHIDAHLNEVIQVQNVQNDLAWNMRAAVDTRSNAARDVVLLQGEQRTAMLATLKEKRTVLLDFHDKLLDSLKKTGAPQKEIDQLEKTMDVDKNAVSTANEMIASAQAGNQAEAEKALLVLRNKLDDTRKEIDSLLEMKKAAVNEAAKAAGDAYGAAKTTMMILLMVALIAAAGVAWLMTRSITQPVNRVLNAVERVAQGDLTASIQPDGNNEIARLEGGVKTMTDTLRQFITQVRNHANVVAETSQSLKLAAQEVRSGSETQSESATAMAAALQEISASINHVAILSDDTRAIAVAASEGATQGNQRVVSLLDEIRKIYKTVETGATQSVELGRESERITRIVSVIKEVAEQTNLLALNAAIEAARAGESGRGFAVVADEVRKLAERSGNSAQEITAMVQAIQERSRSMSQNMETTVGQIHQGMGMVESFSETIRDIDQGARQTTRVIDELSTALKEQSFASQDLANRVEKIVQMIEGSSHSVASVSSSANDMNAMAEDLLQLVARYRT